MTIASCGALFAGRLADWHAQTERLWARLKDSVFSAKDMAALGYDMLDTSRRSPLEALAKLYGFDLTTVAGRAALIEEHMARVAEAGIKPAWWTAVIARIKDALKRLGFGQGATTDDEIARLLSLARKAASKNATGAPEGAPAQDSRQSLEKPTRAEDVRLANRATEAIRPTNNAGGSGVVFYATAGAFGASLQRAGDRRRGGRRNRGAFRREGPLAAHKTGRACSAPKAKRRHRRAERSRRSEPENWRDVKNDRRGLAGKFTYGGQGRHGLPPQGLSQRVCERKRGTDAESGGRPRKAVAGRCVCFSAARLENHGRRATRGTA